MVERDGIRRRICGKNLDQATPRGRHQFFRDCEWIAAHFDQPLGTSVAIRSGRVDHLQVNRTRIGAENERIAALEENARSVPDTRRGSGVSRAFVRREIG
ncbi:hypothetical protein D9M73_172170 [compost metagenome]